MNCVLTFIFIIISYLASGQMDMYAPKSDSKLTNSDYKKMMNNNAESDPFWKSNKANAFIHLHAPSDSIFKYYYEAVHDDPAVECHILNEISNKNRRAYLSGVMPIKKSDEICKFCDSIERNLDSSLIKQLVVIGINDQKYRGFEHEPWITGKEETARKQTTLDSVNQILIENIIYNKKKYPGYDIVGYDLVDVAFMVIQHADLAYQEKYFPLVEKAVNDRQLYRPCYALLIDRINMRKGLPQIFGTQVVWNKKLDRYELYQVQSLSKINELRKKYWLNPLANYLNQMHAVIPEKAK